MLNTPFSPWPSFTEEEVTKVGEVIASNRVNYWTGEECKAFEVEFAQWAGCDHAIALANGTVALDLALKGLGIGPGDDVIVTPRTFIASASCVVNAGASPIFADVDRESGNLTAQSIEAALTPKTKAVIPVHLAGWPCDMDPIMELAEKHGFKVIEDCAQAHGAVYKGRSVGSIGHVGAWSFCQDKIMTTGGEGGMVTTNDEALWRRMWSFKDHGKDWDAVRSQDHPPGHRFVHHSIGTNWRMLEVQGAIGRIQLRRMKAWTAARNAHAAQISQTLSGFAGEGGPVRLPAFKCATCPGCDETTGCRHARYKYYFYVDPDNLAIGWTRDRIVEEIVKRGVPCQQGSCSEVYEEKAFKNGPHHPDSALPIARELGQTSVLLLVHPTLTHQEIDQTCSVLLEVLSIAAA